MIVAIDPGGTSGIALWDGFREPTSFQMEGDHHRALYNWLSKQSPTVVVYENFKWTTTPASLVAVEYIGVVKLYGQHRAGMRIESQDRSYKQLWKDDKIKALGLWHSGKPHAMDAIRHLLYYVTVRQHNVTFIQRLRTDESADV